SGEETGLEHRVENGIASRHRQRVAAKGRSVGPGDHPDRGALGCKTSADREAVPERLRDRHDVRRNALPFMCEELPGAPHTALNLVIDEHQAELVGNVAQPAQVSLGRGPYAPFALNRLDHYRCGLPAERGAPL